MHDPPDLRWWGNLLGYQASWFIAVIGAGQGAWWPGVAAALAYTGWQLATAPDREAALRTLALALLAGLVIDGLLARAGALHFAAASPAFPTGGAPLWILGLWLAFAMTLLRSLAFVQHRLVLAAVFGAVGAPLAYLGAARGWQAVAFASPAWEVLAALAIAWAVVLPLMAVSARSRA